MVSQKEELNILVFIIVVFPITNLLNFRSVGAVVKVYKSNAWRSSQAQFDVLRIILLDWECEQVR